MKTCTKRRTRFNISVQDTLTLFHAARATVCSIVNSAPSTGNTRPCYTSTMELGQLLWCRHTDANELMIWLPYASSLGVALSALVAPPRHQLGTIVPVYRDLTSLLQSHT